MEKELMNRIKESQEQVKNELSILGNTAHPKLIRIVDLLEDNNNFYIISEIMEGGEIYERLLETKDERFTEAQTKNVIWQVMLGLNYLHQ